MNCPACQAEARPGTPFCANCGARIPDPLIGATLLDRYLIEQKIAVGGFGGIYRGTQLNIGRKVAVKVMHEELCSDANLVARFRREGVVLCNLRDAHTVTTYEVGETDDGRLFIVMELLEGETLLDVFRASGVLPWTRMLPIARSICSALAEAHALGIIHRDLKPANIYLETRQGHTDFVKVLDFGIAKITQGSGIDGGTDLTRMGQAVGTLEYMAPEQLMGGKADGRTDIYTLGVVSYEMITGKRPFAEAMGMELLTAQLSQTLVPPSELVGVPPDVDRLLLKCLAQDVVDRFDTVETLAVEIEKVLAAPSWQTPPASALLARDTIRETERRTKDTVKDVDVPAGMKSAPRTIPTAIPTPVPDTVPQLTAPQLTAPQLTTPIPRAPPAFPGWLPVVLWCAASIAVGGGLAWLLSLVAG